MNILPHLERYFSTEPGSGDPSVGNFLTKVALLVLALFAFIGSILLLGAYILFSLAGGEFRETSYVTWFVYGLWPVWFLGIFFFSRLDVALWWGWVKKDIKVPGPFSTLTAIWYLLPIILNGASKLLTIGGYGSAGRFLHNMRWAPHTLLGFAAFVACFALVCYFVRNTKLPWSPRRPKLANA